MTVTALTHAPRKRSSLRNKALAVGLIAVTSMAYALVGPASAAHADSTVTTAADLVADFTTAVAPTVITLGGDITVAPTDGALVAPTGVVVTIDLAGNDLSVTGPASAAGISVPVGAEVIVTDSFGGGVLTLIGGPSTTTSDSGDGLNIEGTAVISVDAANITGGAVEVDNGNAGTGIEVRGDLTIDGVALTVTGGGSTTGTDREAGYGAYLYSGVVSIINSSDVHFVGGVSNITSYGAYVASNGLLRVTDSSLAVQSGNNAGHGLISRGPVIVTNSDFTAPDPTNPGTESVRNLGVFVAVDSTLNVAGFSEYNVPVTLDGNGGTPAEVIVYGESVNHGLDLLTAPSDVWPPVRTGYTFTGWFSEPTGGFEVPSDIFDDFIEVTSTIYAQWAADAAAPVDPADPAELAATGVTDSSGVIIAGALLLVGLLTLGGAVIARRRV